MKNSVMFRRIVLLLLSAVILSGGISAGIYIYIAQRLYVRTRADELLPIARSIAGIMTDFSRDPRHDEWRLLERDNKDFLGALLHIYDAEGRLLMNAPRETGGPARESNQAMSSDIATVLKGGEISETRKLADGRFYLVVGVPILSDNAVMGAVVFTKPIQELSEAARGMNITLLISTLIAFLLMLAPGYWVSQWLVVPIRRMSDVARAMSKGDFTVRADENQKGEIGELARAMNHFAVESGRMEQTRRDYVANVSHELRTPIAAIRAMGETLRDGMAKAPGKQALFYNHIVRESLRLSRLVDDLLELSRLQSAIEPLAKSPFDLRDAVQSVADVYSHVAAEAGVRFTFCVDLAKPVPVFSNADLIEQVMIILLDNAIKHTPVNGEVTLSVTERGDAVRGDTVKGDAVRGDTVRGDTVRGDAVKGDAVEVAVHDTGEGIPPEDIPHIFERFYTVDKSHSGGGTGLGLSIADEIIKGLGETIRVESSPAGTTFSFTVQKYSD